MRLLRETRLYSILTGTCPVCHKGQMYKEVNPYKLKHILKMNKSCPHCGLKYDIEPYFFYGAMYASYGLGVAIGIAAFIVAHLFFGLDRHYTFIVVVGTLVLSYPVVLRFSRSIWINLFFKFDQQHTSET